LRRSDARNAHAQVVARCEERALRDPREQHHPRDHRYRGDRDIDGHAVAQVNRASSSPSTASRPLPASLAPVWCARLSAAGAQLARATRPRLVDADDALCACALCAPSSSASVGEQI